MDRLLDIIELDRPVEGKVALLAIGGRSLEDDVLDSFDSILVRGVGDKDWVPVVLEVLHLLAYVREPLVGPWVALDLV